MRSIRLICAFLIPAWLGMASAIVGIAGGAKSLLDSGGSGDGGVGGVGYLPDNLRATSRAWYDTLKGLQGDTGALTERIDPILAATLGKMLGIDTAPLVEAGQAAGGQYGDLAQMARSFSELLGKKSRDTFAAGQDVYNLARDPQEALYGRTLQRLMDQTRAGQSARGIVMSPYAAGGEADQLRNFNIDWENNLLQRAISGLDAMNRSAQMGGAQATGALQFGAQQPAYTLAAGQAPIDAATAAYNLPATAARSYASDYATGILSPQAAIMSQIVPYLNQGVGATQVNYAGRASDAATEFRNEQAGLSNIYGGLGTANTVLNTPGSWLNNVFGSGGSDYGSLYNAAYGSEGSGGSIYG